MKSVILFNRREMTYAVIGINYSDEEANMELSKLHGLGGFHVDQQGKMYNSEAQLDARMKEITKGRVSKTNL